MSDKLGFTEARSVAFCSSRKHSSGGIVCEMSPRCLPQAMARSLNWAISVSQRSRDMVPRPLRRVASISIKERLQVHGWIQLVRLLVDYFGVVQVRAPSCRTAATMAFARSGFLLNHSPLTVRAVVYGS